MAKIVVETELGTKQFDKQIQKLKSDLSRYMRVLESDAKVPVSLRMSTEERRELEATIEKTRNQLISLQQQAQKTGDIGEEAGEKSGKGFEKGLKSLKRFALGLFGIRTAFAGLRRATSAYLAENEVTANKMNAIWVALGNALGPLIEIIANGVLKLIGYLNVFLNALGFKVDLTKNIGKNTKAIKEQTKAQKELNRQTAQFDEMNVMSSNTSAGAGGGGGAGSNAFEMPELNEKIVNKLKDLAKWLKENWDWIWKVGAALGAVFGIAKISGLLGNIGKLLGNSTTGLLGLKGVLYALLAYEVITITIKTIKVINAINQMKELNDGLKKFTHQNTENSKKVNDANLEIVKSYEKGSKEIEKYTRELNSQNESYINNIENHKKANKEMDMAGQIIGSLNGDRSRNNEIVRENTQRLINNVKNYQELAKEGKLTDEQMKDYNKTMDYLNGVSKELNEKLKLNVGGMGALGLGVENTDKKLYDQIQVLKDNKKQFADTYDNNNTKVNNFWTNIKNKFADMNKLNATGTVKIKTDTSSLSSVFESLSNTFGGTFGSPFKNMANKLKAMGLAKGGIINLPGKGVTLGTSIVGGEATGGAEGVVPMNNEESMNVLGQAIARYVNINITSNTLLDGKVIAREQKKLSNNTDFATNGRGIQ